MKRRHKLHEGQSELPLCQTETWLDWWCAVRWRAFLTWVALSWLMMRFDNYWSRQVALDWITTRLAPSTARGWFLTSTWVSLCTACLMGWFQPILLRLSLVRTIAWIGTLVLGDLLPDVLALHGEFRWMYYEFYSASLPGVVLIGERSRPWMIIPAAALSVFIQCVSMSLAEWQGFSSGHVYYADFVISSVPYAAVLLYGTRRLLRDARFTVS
jgi:hypothetical protein